MPHLTLAIATRQLKKKEKQEQQLSKPFPSCLCDGGGNLAVRHKNGTSASRINSIPSLQRENNLYSADLDMKNRQVRQ